MDPNEIIKKDQQLDGNSGGVPNTNLDAESEYVMLPSKGIFYPEPFKGLEKLKVRKLNWEDEDILTTQSYYDNGTLFDEILKNTIIDDKFSASQLVPVDRDTILWWLRIGAFGKDYEVPWKCTNKECGKTHKVTWDLGTFKTPIPPEQYEEELINTGGIIISLPISKLTCKISISSIGREREIEKRLKVKKEKTKATRDFYSTGKLLSIIKEVYDKDGNALKDTDQILNWLRTGFNGGPVPMGDTRYVFKRANEISFTVDTRIDIVCPHCGHTEEGVRMPMSIYFFWPEFEELSGVSAPVN